MDKVRVAVVGATGMVGQRFVKLLENHSMFELVALTASPASVGKRYSEAAHWYVEGQMPEGVAEMKVSTDDPNWLKALGVEVAFTALPAEVALKVEPELAKAGINVLSDASTFRMEKDVPVLIPEVNPEHLKLLEVQRRRRGWRGCIITNPNCTTTVLVMSLKPLLDNFGVKRVIVSTMQAVSGAGWGGVPSMAIIDNVIPYIAKEEEKVEAESLKILGSLNQGEVKAANFKISASCHRVNVLDGHLEAVFVELGKAVEAVEVINAMKNFKGKPQELKLPTAPQQPIIVKDEPDRPQPRFDRYAGGGMSVAVGRVRRDPAIENGVKYVVLGHNTIRGAAGNSVLNAELLVKEGLL
ncbi:MAG: aspartate-semialdehyde dehydrogenase [Candidatus Nezhaarchaeales archaeon]